jgi:hypothetical protein
LIGKKYLHYLIGLLISAVFLYLFLRRTDFEELGQALIGARYWWLLPGSMINLSGIFLRAVRWRYFFSNEKHVPILPLWSATAIGFMANCLLPARIGEAVRAWVLSQKTEYRFSHSFATIITERAFDFLSILILFLLFFGFFLPGDIQMEEREVFFRWIYRAAWIMGGISVGGILFLVLLKWKQQVATRIVTALLAPFPHSLKTRASGTIDSFVGGLFILNNAKRLLVVFVLSLLMWLIFAMNTLCVFKALDIDATLQSALFIIIIVAFAVSIPSAPGFVGTYHLAAQKALELWVVESPETLKAFAILAHAVSFIPVTVVGLIFLWVSRISFKELSTVKPEESEDLSTRESIEGS